MRLDPISSTDTSLLYEVKDSPWEPVPGYIVTSPESRSICNDPFVVGVDYTTKLRKACAEGLRLLRKGKVGTFNEETAVVLHILRGGLNFGLREALHDAFGWNSHSSAFVSAQRARKRDNPEDWIITESEYQKLSFGKDNHIIFGDVVATGTSLAFALNKLGTIAEVTGSNISSVTFFTIGSPRSHEILLELDQDFRKRFKSYQGSRVVYFEGVFEMATSTTPMQIKIDGTDLLRRGSLLAPEFIESQYENPAFALERCTIYDAGSRAFDLPEYFSDISEYWTQTEMLALDGLKYSELLTERFPELEARKFKDLNLLEVCRKQISKIPKSTNHNH